MARPVSIEVRNVDKQFRVVSRSRSDSRHSPLRHPLGGGRNERVLRVLEDISFDVKQGEFFGIVGRNGSGKSTLLKLLASVYRADAGTIRIAGRLAPFLELGVGFNPRLAAYENVVLNGVMMGLTPAQAAARYERIIDFAGLGEHADMPLKNYSSGMKVRLAFAVMTHVDADVLLMDEVLAVGDAEFQQKCESVFTEMRKAGKTIVLVTHGMAAINTYCDRAMLIHDGRITVLGEPIEVANRYLEVNLLAARERGKGDGYAAKLAQALADPPARVTDVWMIGDDGARNESVAEGEPIEVLADIEAIRDLDSPSLQFNINDQRGELLFRGSPPQLDLDGGRLPAGERVRVRARVDNRFGPGRYMFACFATERGTEPTPDPASRVAAFPFEVTGREDAGKILLDHELSLEPTPNDDSARR